MSIVNELKKEIIRLSRKEISKELVPVKRVNAAQRGLIANLRREVVALQKEVHTLRKAGSVAPAAVEAKPEQPGFWITGKGIKAIRKRLGISQVQLAKLVGVSDQTVVNWEKNEGKINLRRKETGVRLAELRSMNKRTVAEELQGNPKSK
jgi:DNA-binding transcriptional regulator YiaG